MKNILIDEKLRQLASQTTLKMPEDCEKRVDQLLDELTQKNTPRGKLHRFMIAPKAAMIVLSCLLIGSAGVYATINHVQQRMTQMEEGEIAELYTDIQNSTEDKDYYSRSLTSEERERLDALLVQYREQGVFPEQELLQIDAESERPENGLCFLSSTSTFYLPDRELSDEELLELIEFYYKRDYSLKESTSSVKSTESKTQGIEHVSQEDIAARDAAVCVVEKLYDIDLAQRDYDVTRDSAGKIRVRFTMESDFGYTVCLNQDYELNEVEQVQSIGNYQNDAVENVDCQKKYELVLQMLEKLDIEQEQIKQVHAQYAVDETNENVWQSRVLYKLEMQDGSGYIAAYNTQTDCVYRIAYQQDYSFYEELTAQQNEQIKQFGYTQINVSIQK